MRRLCAAALERVVARSPDVRAAQAGVAGAAAALAVTMAVRLNGAPAAKARGQQTLVDAAAGMALNDARGIVEQAVGDDVAAQYDLLQAEAVLAIERGDLAARPDREPIA